MSTFRRKLADQLYREVLWHCWSCGRGETEQHQDWHAPWYLQLAHLRSGGGMRAQTRKAVNVLCPMCHELHLHRGGSWRTKRINGVLYPTLSDAAMLWLKSIRDAEHYDPEYVGKLWIGNLPEPEEPSAFFLDQYRRRHGGRPRKQMGQGIAW